MKKRRELDALVNGNIGKLGRRKKKGEHELLRSESESSEIEEFSIPQKSVVRKRNTSRFCATCVTVCGIFLLIACIVSITGLVWVHVKLKMDVDQLRSQLAKVEKGNQENKDDLQSASTTRSVTQAEIQQIKNVQLKIQANLTNVMLQLNATINHLQKLAAKSGTIDIASDAGLAKNVADLGYKVKDSEEKMAKQSKDMQELSELISNQNTTMMARFAALVNVSTQHQTHIDKLQLQGSSLDNRLLALELSQTTRRNISSINNIGIVVSKAMEQLKTELWNFTSSGRYFDEVVQNMGNLTLAVKDLEKKVYAMQGDVPDTDMNERVLNLTYEINKLRHEVTNLNLLPGLVQNLNDSQTTTSLLVLQLQQTVDNHVTRLHEAGPNLLHLDILNNVTDVATTASTGTDSSGNMESTQNPYLTHDGHLIRVEVQGIRTCDDVDKNFVRWDTDHDHKVQYFDLQHFLGEDTPEEEHLTLFNYDEEPGYTLDELRKAFGFNPSADCQVEQGVYGNNIVPRS